LCFQPLDHRLVFAVPSTSNWAVAGQVTRASVSINEST
jgi:hypothetical protein